MLGDSPSRRLWLGAIAALLMCMFVSSTASASTLSHHAKHKHHKKGHTALAAADAVTLDSLQAEILALQAKIDQLLAASTPTVGSGTTTPAAGTASFGFANGQLTITLADGTTIVIPEPVTITVAFGPPVSFTVGLPDGVTFVITPGGQRSPSTVA